MRTNPALKAAITALSPIHGGEAAAMIAVADIRDTVVQFGKHAELSIIALMMRYLGITSREVASDAARALLDDIQTAA